MFGNWYKLFFDLFFFFICFFGLLHFLYEIACIFSYNSNNWLISNLFSCSIYDFYMLSVPTPDFFPKMQSFFCFSS
jgi:hypothetical protein